MGAPPNVRVGDPTGITRAPVCRSIIVLSTFLIGMLPLSPVDATLLARRLRGMGSSFFWATQLLPVARREATYRIYAFCRELEDIVDGEAASSVKHSLFAEWRNEIASLYAGEPRHALTRGLSDAVRLYGLRSDDFVAVINGREMDLPSGIRAPTLTELDLYCVAAAPARLTMRIFGEETSMGEQVAAELGRALHLTIILRDLRKAAERQRLTCLESCYTRTEY